MADHNHIPPASAETLRQHYDANMGTVRDSTNTAANTKAAGTPSE
jgi:hypothetical protein